MTRVHVSHRGRQRLLLLTLCSFLKISYKTDEERKFYIDSSQTFLDPITFRGYIFSRLCLVICESRIHHRKLGVAVKQQRLRLKWEPSACFARLVS